jgi:hypothetical protein
MINVKSERVMVIASLMIYSSFNLATISQPEQQPSICLWTLTEEYIDPPVIGSDATKRPMKAPVHYASEHNINELMNKASALPHL